MCQGFAPLRYDFERSGVIPLDEIAALDRSRYPRGFRLLQPHLDEKTKRLVGAATADSVGRGGQRMVQETTGLSSPTLKLGPDQGTGVESVSKNLIRRVGRGRRLINDEIVVNPIRHTTTKTEL